ncbi:MAG: PRTRC system protein B [Bacteroidetes bacterium]|nr:PRTRC system protein B [Bacteroidota bacterium]
MSDITNDFGSLYLPHKAFVIYGQEGGDGLYVESYDMDRQGYPINAHPLSVREAKALAKALDTAGNARHSFLKPHGLMPRNILYVNPDQEGYAVWHTPRQTVPLLFRDGLDIPSGNASVPAMIWRATRQNLYVFAVKETEQIAEQLPLYTAPFFNIYDDGKVCMGTVRIQIGMKCGLEEFISKWQQYFFDSYFSHLIAKRSPVKSNIVQLWQSLVNTGRDFPEDELMPTSFILQNLLK